MLSLFRGGPVIWMSARTPPRSASSDNDWIEAYNRNGVVVAARRSSRHRMPQGTVYMYHAKDRVRERAELRDDRARAAAPTTR